MKTMTTTLLTAPLVPVRETQKNITKYFKKGIARVTKNGRSLGYLMSDEILEELMEDLAASHPHFIEIIKKESESEKLISADDLFKTYGITE